MTCGIGTSSLHWLLNGRGLRHVRSSLHHLQLELHNQRSGRRRDRQQQSWPRFRHHHQLCHHALQLIGVGCTCDVFDAVAQLLFPSFDTQGLQQRKRILESTTARLLLMPSNLSFRVFLEVRNTRVHIGHDFIMWICGTACSATMQQSDTLALCWSAVQ